jgi:hypothetical protein
MMFFYSHTSRKRQVWGIKYLLHEHVVNLQADARGAHGCENANASGYCKSDN